jgi:parvulin-like peptidyl-prolyl isomerase
MNCRSFPLFLLPLILCAQVKTPPQELTPDTVIATIDGRKLTYGEIQTYLDGLTPEQKTQALNDRKQLVQQYALMVKLLEFAEKDKLAQQSPYKEALDASRKQILTNAELNYRYIHTLVTADDQKKFYDANKDRYTQVKLQVLYLGFVADTAAKESNGKYRTQEQAKKKVEELRAQVHTGDDFVRIVKQYSEDEESKARNGDYGTVKKSDNLPPEIKNIVFALKEGELSQPVLQRNGFYIFRAQTVGLRPYDEVKDEIYNELKETRVRQWIGETQSAIPLKFENDAFFSSSAPQPR